MSIKLTDSPKSLLADLIQKRNPVLPELTASDISVRQVNAVTLDTWDKAAQGTRMVGNDVTGSPYVLAPVVDWFSPEGVFVVRKLVTFPSGDIVFKVNGNDETKLYIDGNLRMVNDHAVDGMTTLTISNISGEHDVAIVCSNSSGYGNVYFSFYSGTTSVAVSNNSWSCRIAGIAEVINWYDVASTAYLDWSPSVLYPNHPWEDDSMVGDFVYNGSSSEYTAFATRLTLNSPTEIMNFKSVNDNGGWYSINGGGWLSIRSRSQQEIVVPVNEDFVFSILVLNIGGPAGIQCDISDADGNLITASTTAWQFQVVGTYDTYGPAGVTWNEASKQYLGGKINDLDFVTDATTVTTAEVDLLIEPSESYGDYLEFTYNRIPVNALFNNIDSIIDEKHYSNWPMAEVSNYDGDETRDQDLIPVASMISPLASWNIDYGMFICKKVLTFIDTTARLVVRANEAVTVYVDGVNLGTHEDWTTTATFEMSIVPGEHTVAILTTNYLGDCFTEFAIYDDERFLDKSDETWPCLIVTVDDDINDLCGIYETDKVELSFDISEVDMLTDSVSNFAAIYDNWYRFSHRTGDGYPAIADELNGWSYLPEYDCIQSTTNSVSHIGFMSDDKSDDYIFNTVVTSYNNDDDFIGIVFAALKQGEYDDNEHTLALRLLSRETTQYGALLVDYFQTGAENLGGFSGSNEAKNLGWKNVYMHVYAVRKGSSLTVYVKRYLDEALAITATRDAYISELVENLSTLGPTDFTTLRYQTRTIDIDTAAPMFSGPQHYGYSQLSQAAARFWNIQRPNENPAITPELRDHIVRRYGVNLGDDGVEVSSLGNNSYQIDVDNIVYVGSFTMNPITE